ncbi:MAG: hypothetical protein U0T74_05625 [Chitinophagales bacterium]
MLLIMTLISNCKQPSNHQFTKEDMIAEAEKLDEQYISSLNVENLDGVMSCYWNDSNLFVYAPGDILFTNWDSLKFSFKRYFESVEGGKNELFDVKHKIVGDFIVEWGKRRNTLYGTNPKVPPMILENQYMAIVANKNGKWVYVVDHAGQTLQLSPNYPQ